MWFEQVKEWITWFFNLPLPIAGVTVGTVCVFAFIIFRKTSLGKRMYNKAIKETKEAVDKLNEYKDLADVKVKALKNSYEEKLQIVNEKNEKLEKLLLAITPYIHNAKVQEVVSKYIKESKEVIAICDVIDDKVVEVKEQATKEADKVIEEYKAKLQAEFDAKQKELDELIAKYEEVIKDGKAEVSEVTEE